MNITLYKNISEKNRLDKTLIEPIPLVGTLKAETSLINPILIIESESVITSNYLYILEFDRFYYINDITVLRNNLYQLSCSVDVLTTWKSAILNLDAIIEKQKEKADMYIDDGSFVNECRTFNTIINFDNGFNEVGELILITCGKAVNE